MEQTTPKNSKTTAAGAAAGACVAPLAGPAAAARVVTLAFGHVLGSPDRDWAVRIERRWNGQVTWSSDLDSPEAVNGFFDGIESAVDDPRATLSVSLWLHRPWRPEGMFKSPHERAQTGFAIQIPHLAMFAPGAPLSSPRKLDERGRVDPRRVSAEERLDARAIICQSLEALPTPPAIIVERWNFTEAFFLMKQALLDRGQVYRRIEDVQKAVARQIDGAVPVGMQEGLTLPMIGSQEGKRFTSAVLAAADALRAFDLEAIERQHRDPGRALCAGSTPRPGRWKGKPAVLLGARTLAEGFALEDLDLPQAFLDVLRGGPLDQEAAGRWAPQFALEMGLRRFGWLDVAALMRDRRFAFGAHRRSTIALSTLRMAFERALEDSRPTIPTRLPFGIRQIIELRTSVGAPRRFRVMCGPRAKALVLEVSESTLMSPRRFRSAVARATGQFPSDVDERTWDAMIRAGFADPRVARRATAGEPARAPRPEDAVWSYRPGAGAWLEDGGEPHWPVLRDGRVVFKRRHFERHLMKELGGESLSRREVTALLIACGGVEIGTVRIGKKFHRCWSLPEAART